jgi:hypothetical protein
LRIEDVTPSSFSLPEKVMFLKEKTNEIRNLAWSFVCRWLLQHT